jgi:hypothetical protein
VARAVSRGPPPQSDVSGAAERLVLVGVSTWVEDLDELEALIPAYSEWHRRVGRFIKYAL